MLRYKRTPEEQKQAQKKKANLLRALNRWKPEDKHNNNKQLIVQPSALSLLEYLSKRRGGEQQQHTAI